MSPFQVGTTFGGRAALALMLLAALAAPAAGQAVDGQVVDAESGEGIEQAELVLRDARGSVAARTRTNAEGRFLLSASVEGRFVIEVERLGYLAPEPIALELGRERVSVEIRLGRAPLALEPLTVTGRRADPRHDGTFEGARSRHDIFPVVGPRRVIMRGDWELEGASTVGGVVALTGFPRGCTIVWWNGSLVSSDAAGETWMDHTSPEAVEAVEFYRRWSDAPAAYRPIPPWVAGNPNACSVVALWPRLDPRVTDVPAWRRALSVTVFGGGLWFLGRWLTGR